MKALILPLLIFLGSLVFGYFSLESIRKFNDEQKLRLDTKEENRKVSASADAKETELSKAKMALEETKATHFAATDRVSNLTRECEGLQGNIREMEQALAVYDNQKKRLEERAAEVEKLAEQIGRTFNIDSCEDMVNTMKAEKEDRIKRVDELDVKIADMEKAIIANTEELAKQTAREAKRQRTISRCSMEAVITGVNQDWGFLVIGAGQNSGFTPQSVMIVQRDGKMIAKVRPSQIEPNQTIAEILFDTLTPGVRIQPGDRVIYQDPLVAE